MSVGQASRWLRAGLLSRVQDLAVTEKLGIGFGIMIAVALLSAAFVTVQTRQLAEMERVNSTSDQAVERLEDMRFDIESSRASIRNYVIGGSSLDRDRILASLRDADQHARETRAIIARDGTPELLAAFDAYADAARRYDDESTRRYLLLAASGRRAAVIAMIAGHGGRQVRAAMEGRYATLREQAGAWAQYWDRQGTRAVMRTSAIVLVTGALTALACAAMALFVSRTIATPLRRMTAAMNALAAGDTGVAVPAIGSADEIGAMSRAVLVFKAAALEKDRLEREADAAAAAIERERSRNDARNAERAREQAYVFDQLAAGLNALARGHLAQRLDAPFPPDYEPLRTDFNAAIAQLGDAVREVAANTAAIEAGARDMSTSSDDISRRSSEQAQSLQTAAAVLDGITLSVAKSATTVEQARQGVAHARAEAERSGEIVRQTVAAIGQIEHASAEVLGATELIDGIARKTNLLALNAAVEAARAGVEGRGFAVVAAEVRSLAHQAAEAARQIKSLTIMTDSQIREGVKLVGLTGTALEAIVGQVVEINDAAAEISHTTKQQSAALARANTAIGEIEGVTRRNAAMADRATLAAHSLSEQTQNLDRLVSHFIVG